MGLFHLLFEISLKGHYVSLKTLKNSTTTRLTLTLHFSVRVT